MPPPAPALVRRCAALRQAVADAGHSALLVSNLANLHYLTGVAVSAGLAVVTPDTLLLVTDGRYAAAIGAAASTIDAIVVPVPRGGSYEHVAADVAQRLALTSLAVEAHALTLSRAAAIREAMAGAVTLVETTGTVEHLRAIKDSWEQDTLRDAGQRLSRAAACILTQVRPGHTERDVAWAIAVTLHDAGFDRLAFEPIVASGPHAARPHHRAGDRRLQAGDVVVVDFGGQLDGYSVDMTRTIALEPIGRDEATWLTAVDEAQRAALEVAGPGVWPSAVDAAARKVLAGYGLAEAFVHGTGHGLGLEVHERPTIGPRGDGDGALAPGMVFTVEPGVYVEGRGGVRLEDDVLVTPTGVERLTGGSAPGRPS